MSRLAFDLDENDDVGFVHQVRPIVAGVLRVVEPAEAYVVKIDNWFGQSWLGFSNKVMGGFGTRSFRALRVPPFVPTRVVAQRFYRRGANGEYVEDDTSVRLHIDQTSEDNRQRFMSVVCPRAAVFWWSGGTRTNQRGSLMAYFPTSAGSEALNRTDAHSGWYVDFKKVREWSVGNALRTTTRELSTYARAE